MTVTLNVEVAVLPCASAAEQVTVVVPNANVEPEVGEQFTITAPSTISVAVGAMYVTTVPEELVVNNAMFPWDAIVGAVVSLTVIVKAAEPVL